MLRLGDNLKFILYPFFDQFESRSRFGYRSMYIVNGCPENRILWYSKQHVLRNRCFTYLLMSRTLGIDQVSSPRFLCHMPIEHYIPCIFLLYACWALFSFSAYAMVWWHVDLSDLLTAYHLWSGKLHENKKHVFSLIFLFTVPDI